MDMELDMDDDPPLGAGTIMNGSNSNATLQQKKEVEDVKEDGHVRDGLDEGAAASGGSGGASGVSVATATATVVSQNPEQQETSINGSNQSNSENDQDQVESTHNVISIPVPAKGLNLGPLNTSPLSLPDDLTFYQPQASMPMATTTSKLALAEVQLHSPSQIIGTPFATDSSRFEYPFPATSTSPSASLPDFGSSCGQQQSVLSTSPTFPTLSPGSAFSSSTSASDQRSASAYESSASSSPPSIIHHPPQAVVSSSFPPSSSVNEKVAHHPKLKVTVAPIPPNVAKKRHRWSLSMLTRRGNGVVNGAGAEASLEDTHAHAHTYTHRLSPRTPPAVPDIPESPLEHPHAMHPTTPTQTLTLTPPGSGTRKDSLLRKLTRRRSQRNGASIPPSNSSTPPS